MNAIIAPAEATDRAKSGHSLVAHIDDLMAAYGEQHMLGHLSTGNFKMAKGILETLRRLTTNDILVSTSALNGGQQDG